MKIGILKETSPENRVALTPDSVVSLTKLNVQVMVEKSAGVNACFSDEDFRNSGAEIKAGNEVIKNADVLIMVNPPGNDRLSNLRKEQVIIGVFNPYFNKELVKKLMKEKITSFSMELVPRITRAQSMDVLSSMATIAGYKAVLEAANSLPKFFPMFMSAAGTVRPAKVLILGAGVAGLQAIAIARKLGAVVEVFDVRSAAKEEVLSLGGKFIEVEGSVEDKSAGGYAVEQTEEYKRKQGELIQDHAVKSDVVICTAQIPGRKAPLLIKAGTVEKMKAGSVIVDLAASTGGNCELTKNNETVIHDGVKIIGNSDFPSMMPSDASSMFGKNILNFLKLIIDEKGDLNLNFEDEIVEKTCLTHNGEIRNQKTKETLNI